MPALEGSCWQVSVLTLGLQAKLHFLSFSLSLNNHCPQSSCRNPSIPTARSLKHRRFSSYRSKGDIRGTEETRTGGEMLINTTGTRGEAARAEARA